MLNLVTMLGDEELFQLTEVDQIWERLKQEINNVCDLLVPKVTTSDRKPLKWFTKPLKHLLNCVHTQRRKVKASPCDRERAKLSELEAKLQDGITDAKGTYRE